MTNAERPMTGKIAVVTGGGRGIGAAIAERLAKLGATVIVCGRSVEPLRATAARISAACGQCEAMQCDVAHLGSVDNLARRVRQTFGHCDILVNNAGVGSFSSPLHLFPPDEWEKVINTNLRGAYFCLRAFAPMMIEAGGGDIINISSLAGKNALPNGLRTPLPSGG